MSNLLEGLVLKEQKYQEDSKIAYVLTSIGLKSYLVRGAYKVNAKNASYSVPLTKISFDYSSKNNFNVLKQGKVLNNYSKIKANYELLLGALEVLDYTYDFANHVSDYDLFYQFVIFTLDKLEETGNLYYIAIFKLKLLYLLGIGPVLNRCVLCGSKENLIGFSLNKAGLICKECNDYSLIKLDDFMKTIIVMYYTKLEDLNEEMFDLKYLDKINKLLDQYYEIHLTYKSKANKVIKKIK